MKSIQVSGVTIQPCTGHCDYEHRSRHSHYHCICGSVIQRFERMQQHCLKKHSCSKPDLVTTVSDDGSHSRNEVTDSNALRDVTCTATGHNSIHSLAVRNHDRRSTQCDVCKKVMLMKNLQRHVKTAHGSVRPGRCLPCILIDSRNGIFLCATNAQGTLSPIHVQVKTSSSQQLVACEKTECREAQTLASRIGFVAFQCTHIKSTTFADNAPAIVLLDDAYVHNLAENHVIKTASVTQMKQLRDNANKKGVAAVVWWQPTVNGKLAYMSVYTDCIKSFSLLCRCTVQVTIASIQLDCSCCSRKSGCIHKKMCLWYMLQCKPELYALSHSTPQAEQHALVEANNDLSVLSTHSVDCDDAAVSSDVSTQTVPRFVREVAEDNLIPADIEPVHVSSELSSLMPLLSHCLQCKKQLSTIVLCYSGRIFDIDRVITGVVMHGKLCPNCEHAYRYSRYDEGLHNFNNEIIITHRLALYLRSAIKRHTAITRALDVLSDCFLITFPRHIHSAYLHFEASSAHTYQFSCALCGHFPHILVLDGNKKCAFRLNTSDIDREPIDSLEDRQNMKKFWSDVQSDILDNGFTNDASACPMKRHDIKPRYSHWVPWINPSALADDMVFNTEYRKCPEFQTSDVNFENDRELSEEFLIELLCESDVRRVKQVAAQVGISQKGSKLDIISRLQSSLTDSSLFRKAFSTLWGSSGGVVTASCHHGVVYAMKVLLRGESVRDHIDILLSFKHLPNLVINDMPGMTARHGNIRKANMFKPNEGRFAAFTEDNMKKLKEGSLAVNLKIFDQMTFDHTVSCESQVLTNAKVTEAVHPVTKSADCYCAVDRFHEKNMKTEADKLRRLTIVPQLSNGLINSQVQEQLFSSLRKDVYFLNSMSPPKFLFMLRLIFHLRNNAITAEQIASAKKLFAGSGVNLHLCVDGRLNCHDINQPCAEQVVRNYRDPDELSMLPDAVRQELPHNTCDSDDAITTDKLAGHVVTVESSGSLHEHVDSSIAYHSTLKNAIQQFRYAVEVSHRDPDFVNKFNAAVTINLEQLSSSLTDLQRVSVITNLAECTQLLTGQVNSRRQKEVRTVFGENNIAMQIQGATNYCGLCCVNNAIGPLEDGSYPLTIQAIDNIADELLLDMLLNANIGLTCQLQKLRDIEGFYSYDVLQACFKQFGYEMVHINVEHVISLTAEEFVTYVVSVCGDDVPTAFVIREANEEHWTCLRLYNDHAVKYDSKASQAQVVDTFVACSYMLDQITSPTKRGSVSVVQKCQESSQACLAEGINVLNNATNAQLNQQADIDLLMSVESDGYASNSNQEPVSPTDAPAMNNSTECVASITIDDGSVAIDGYAFNTSHEPVFPTDAPAMNNSNECVASITLDDGSFQGHNEMLDSGNINKLRNNLRMQTTSIEDNGDARTPVCEKQCGLMRGEKRKTKWSMRKERPKKKFSSSWVTNSPRIKVKEPKSESVSRSNDVEEDDTIENVIEEMSEKEDVHVNVNDMETTWKLLGLSKRPLAPLEDFVPENYLHYVPDELAKTCVINSFNDQEILEKLFPGRFTDFIIFDFQDEPYKVPSMNDTGERSKQLLDPNVFNVLCDYADWPERFRQSDYL